MNSDLFTGFWNIIKEVWDYVKICTFVYEWQGGVLVRFGRFRRKVSAGIIWHLPFGWDELVTMNIKPSALELEEQALTTNDGKQVTLRAVLIWSVFDTERCLIDVEDAEETLGDIAVGIIQDMVEVTDWDDIRTSSFRKAVCNSIQKQARKWGISVSTVKFQDLTLASVYKLFGCCE